MPLDGQCGAMAPRAVANADRAVSPVIGVILVVAVTVILASVVGTFAFGLFDRDTNPAPSVVFEGDYDGVADELVITHQSGNEFQRADIEFEVSGGDGSVGVARSWPTTVDAADATTLDGVDPDETVRVVWQDPRKGDDSAVLYVWSGPNA